MKTDRILEIIIYLLNHENVSASRLAARFGVSVRTIQRDMVSISLIGIPVYSSGGKNGGYSILPEFKLKNSNIRPDEQQMIVKALESLATSYTNDTLQSLIEKYNAIIDKEGGQRIFWDFSVSRENKRVQDINAMLEGAVEGKNFVSFEYKNASGYTSEQYVQPLAIHYKWYAWYLFAYSVPKKSYRTYKVARIQNPVISREKSGIEHGDVKRLMEDSERAYYSTCIHIEVYFAAEESSLIEEYFPDCPIEALSGGKCRTFIDVPPNERLWKALLLSFGGKVRVASPESYRNELLETAQTFYLRNCED